MTTATAAAVKQVTVIDQVRAILAADENLSQAQVAKQAGISEAVLSALMAGTYGGNVERNLNKLAKFIKTRHQKAETKALVRGPQDEWLPLPTALRIEAVMKNAQHLRAWGLVYQGAGVGKTTTAHHYQSETSNVWIFTADPFRNNEMAVLQGLCDAMKIERHRMTKARMCEAIVKKITGSDGLLIIDEGQYLSGKILNGIRVLTDDRIGVVLMGNDLVRTQLTEIGNVVDMNPVWSRVITSLALPTVSRQDIVNYLKVWGVEDKEVIRFVLDKIPKSVGAMRSLNRLLQVATAIATTTGTALGLGEAQAAWKNIGVVE